MLNLITFKVNFGTGRSKVRIPYIYKSVFLKECLKFMISVQSSDLFNLYVCIFKGIFKMSIFWYRF